MARKKFEVEPQEAAPEPAGEPTENGDARKRPAFKVGPIATGKGESVAGCVWENIYEANGSSYRVHSIVLDVSYFNEKVVPNVPAEIKQEVINLHNVFTP